MFGRKAKIRKAVDRALAGVEADTDLADHAPIEALPAALQLQAYYTLVLALHEDERHAAARHSLQGALALAPDDPELQRLAARVSAELGDVEDAISAQRRALAAAPRDTATVATLADLLIGAERIEEVIELLRPLRGEHDPELDTKLAEALFVHGDNEEAFAILDEVCTMYDAQLERAYGPEWQQIKRRAEDAERLRNDVYAEMHGREATIELLAAEGKLDAQAGVNYRLLGARLAATSPRIADELVLESPDATEARGQQLLASAPARGLSLIGCAQLRRSELTAARKTFERACAADGRCFAAFVGLGAVLEYETLELDRRVARLKLPAQLPLALAAVVPDLPALTELERRVVIASAQPLAAVLPVLAERGVTIRILPIDVRATDVGLFASAAGERAEDHRSYDAITGVAKRGGAVAKIEELLDIVTDGGWTFAHALAHLAVIHMTEEQVEPLLALYERACELGYANTEYALSNADQFFAVSYTEYLRQRHELPGVLDVDDAGIREALTRYFDELAAMALDPRSPFR